jgi:predicted Zn-dependent peptidase
MVRHVGRSANGTVKSILLAGVVAAALFVCCGKENQEANKSQGGTPSADTGPGEITSFRLENGVTVYLREDHLKPEVALVALYRAGVIFEEKDKVQESRLLPHLLIYSPTASFEAGQAVDSISHFGRPGGEVTGQYARFDYSGPSERLELLLKIESERLTSVRFTEALLEKYANKCAEDVDRVLENPALSLSTYGLMALNQAYNYRVADIPLRDGVFDLTIDDMVRFHNTRYRPDDMALVVVGDFQSSETTELINRYFGSIPDRTAPPARPQPAGGSMTALWDVPATVMFLVSPGPYANDVERVVLTMFGTFLNRQLRGDAELTADITSSLCSNTSNPVGDIPFFVFAHVRAGGNLQDIRSKLVAQIDAAVQKVDAKTFDMMRRNLLSFLQSSVLETQRTLSSISHYKALEQEADNIGASHYLRDGQSMEDFTGLVQSITYDDAKRYLDSIMDPEHMRVVTIRGK